MSNRRGEGSTGDADSGFFSIGSGSSNSFPWNDSEGDGVLDTVDLQEAEHKVTCFNADVEEIDFKGKRNVSCLNDEREKYLRNDPGCDDEESISINEGSMSTIGEDEEQDEQSNHEAEAQVNHDVIDDEDLQQQLESANCHSSDSNNEGPTLDEIERKEM